MNIDLYTCWCVCVCACVRAPIYTMRLAVKADKIIECLLDAVFKRQEKFNIYEIIQNPTMLL